MTMDWRDYDEFLKSLSGNSSIDDDTALLILDALEYKYQQGWKSAEAYHMAGG